MSLKKNATLERFFQSQVEGRAMKFWFEYFEFMELSINYSGGSIGGSGARTEDESDRAS